MGWWRGTLLQGWLLVNHVLLLAGGEQCPGSIQVSGYEEVVLVRAKWDTPGEPIGEFRVDSGALLPRMKGRAYFGNSCTDGEYRNSQYAALPLLGKKFQYTTHVEGASCGCNAALYLSAMRQNEDPSACEDFYCDAGNVCGVTCAEIDIQEANMHAWRSTLHVPDDPAGIGAGYGGGVQPSWTSLEYGPGAKCIDTSLPFSVAVAFPVDDAGVLEAMEVTLTQEGHSCPLSLRLDSYSFGGRNGLAELSPALAAGMAPVVSYWSSPDMLWLDGPGGDPKGPCLADQPGTCGDFVKFYNFSVQSLVNPPVGPPEEVPPVLAHSTSAPTSPALLPPGGDALPSPLLPPTPGDAPTPLSEQGSPSPFAGATLRPLSGAGGAPRPLTATAAPPLSPEFPSPEATTPLLGSVTTSSTTDKSRRDCSMGSPLQWSPEKQVWCCAHANRGCSTSPALTSSLTGTSSTALVAKIATSTTTAATTVTRNRFVSAVLPSKSSGSIYDCSTAANSWTAGQTTWCCEHEERGCGSTTAQSTTASLIVLRAASAAVVPGSLRGRGHGPGMSYHQLFVDGVQRHYVFFLPTLCNTASPPIPLWILVPGAGNSPEKQLRMSDLTWLAEKRNFAIVALEGEEDLMNVEARAQASPKRLDDVAYAKSVLGRLHRETCADPKRVYCTGFSRGARFCSRLASEGSDIVAAIAPVGGVRYPDPNNATRPVPIMAFHGTADPVNPFQGGGDDADYWHAPVDAAIRQWADFNGCKSKRFSRVSASVALERHSDCSAGADVNLVKVEGGGHTWPGSGYHFVPELGVKSKEINASELMWKFFEEHTLQTDAGFLMGGASHRGSNTSGNKDFFSNGLRFVKVLPEKLTEKLPPRYQEYGEPVLFATIGAAVLLFALLALCQGRCLKKCMLRHGEESDRMLLPLEDRDEVRVTVVDVGGRQALRLVTSVTADVDGLKEQIAAASGIPTEQQSLFYGGQLLAHGSMQLGSVGVSDRSTLYLARRFRLGTRPMETYRDR